MLRTHLLVSILCIAAVGCESLDLDGRRFRCERKSDCGDGYVCVKRECKKAFVDENGVFGDRIIFGMSAALDDSELGQIGKAARDGFEAYFAQINADGGVHGRKLELVVKDDRYDAAQTVKNVNELIGGGASRQVFALVGVLGTGPALAARDLAVKNRVLLYAPATGFDALEPDPPDRYVFNVRLRYSDEAAQLTTFLLAKANVPAQNIAVFAQGKDNAGTLDPLGQGGFAGVAQALGDAGVDSKTIQRATYTALTPRDQLPKELAPAVGATLVWMANRERKTAADGAIDAAVVLAALFDSAAGFIQGVEGCLALARAVAAQAKTEADFTSSCGALDSAAIARLAKVSARFASLSTVGAGLPLALKAAGKYADVTPSGAKQRSYGVGTIVASPMPDPSSNASGVIAYREQLSRYNDALQPDPISLEGYVSAWLFVEGLRKHGPDLTTESLISTLETLHVDLGIGTTLSYSPNNHQASTKLWGTQIDENLTYKPLGALVQ